MLGYHKNYSNVGILSRKPRFPAIYKVDNIGIFVQIIMKINWKWLLMISIILQIYICYDLSIENKENDNYINLVVRVKTKMPTLPTLCIMGNLEFFMTPLSGGSKGGRPWCTFSPPPYGPKFS